MTFTCPYFWPEVMVKFTRRVTGHSVMLTETCIHLITCISGHNSLDEKMDLHQICTAQI